MTRRGLRKLIGRGAGFGLFRAVRKNTVGTTMKTISTHENSLPARITGAGAVVRGKGSLAMVS